MRFIYKPITNQKQLGSKRPHKDIKFIVIHDTANYSKGAGAMAHYKYLQNATRIGSAHYYVDDKEIIQTIGDGQIAHAVGDTWANKNRTRSDVKNANSLSLELCVNSDNNFETAYRNTVELAKNLMIKFKIPFNNVVRHKDASGKPCPASMQSTGWERFQKDLKEPIMYKMDLEKNSNFGGVCNACKRPI